MHVAVAYALRCGKQTVAALIPLLFAALAVCAVVKKVNVYNCFLDGAGEAFRLVISLLPCLAAVFMMCEVFEVSGLSDAVCSLLSPVVSWLGIPEELTKLLLIKPFSGSASLGMLGEIINSCGADSYTARCAAVCYGSSETVFYVSAVYFARCKNKSLGRVAAIVLISSLISAVIGCLVCRIM